MNGFYAGNASTSIDEDDVIEGNLKEKGNPFIKDWVVYDTSNLTRIEVKEKAVYICRVDTFQDQIIGTEGS